MATYVRLSFTNEEEKLLIGFIEQHPELWDAACAEYSNASLRQDYWQCIARQLKKSENDCRRKWRFIRDYYLHKRKLKSGVSDKAAPSKYHNLNFLRKLITQRTESAKGVSKRQSNICNSELIGEDDETLLLHDAHADSPQRDEEHLEEASDSDFDSVTIDIANQNEDNSQQEQEEHEIFTDILYDGEDMTRFSADVDCAEKKFESTHNSAQSTSARVCDAAQERAIDLFFASMAAAVKTFPPYMVTQAKATVFQAINELELQLYKQIPQKK